MESFRVTPIGTCRVHRPLRKMAEMHGIEIFRNPLNRYVHTTGEITQRVKVLKGVFSTPKKSG